MRWSNQGSSRLPVTVKAATSSFVAAIRGLSTRNLANCFVARVSLARVYAALPEINSHLSNFSIISELSKTLRIYLGETGMTAGFVARTGWNTLLRLTWRDTSSSRVRDEFGAENPCGPAYCSFLTFLSRLPSVAQLLNKIDPTLPNEANGCRQPHA